MHREVRDKLIANLESGRFKKTTGALHRINGEEHSYCCLGVLTEQAIEDGVELYTNILPGVQIVEYNCNGSTLSEAVMAYSGITTSNGSFSVDGKLYSYALTDLNDQHEGWQPVIDALRTYF